MNILSLDHITINVKDLETTKAFYRDVLKLRESGFIHMGDHTLTYFRLTAECRLELIHYLTDVATANVSETDRGIYRHFCLETDNLTQVWNDCLSHGAVVRKEPSYVDKLGCSTMLITDPNGVEIEIIQK
jgi:lactoylglutathione lyase